MVGLVRMGGRVSRRFAARVVCGVASFGALLIGANGSAAQQSESTQNQPRRIPERAEIRKASLQGSVRDDEGRAVPAVLLTIRSISDGTSYESTTDAEGIFRMRDIPLGVYELKAVRDGYEPLVMQKVQLSSAGLTVLGIGIKRNYAAAPPSKGVSGIPGNPRTPSVPEAPASS